MSLSSTCIKRPVFATVINVVLILIGFIGLAFLGVRDYPSVDPPIISVSDQFSGSECRRYRNSDHRTFGSGDQRYSGNPGIDQYQP